MESENVETDWGILSIFKIINNLMDDAKVPLNES
jgi:hypothetical protein